MQGSARGLRRWGRRPAAVQRHQLGARLGDAGVEHRRECEGRLLGWLLGWMWWLQAWVLLCLLLGSTAVLGWAAGLRRCSRRRRHCEASPQVLQCLQVVGLLALQLAALPAALLGRQALAVAASWRQGQGLWVGQFCIP